MLPAKDIAIVEAVEASVAEYSDPEPLSSGALRAEQAIVVTSDAGVSYMALFSARVSTDAGLVSVPAPRRRTSAPPLVFLRRALPARAPPAPDTTRHGTVDDTSMVGAFATPHQRSAARSARRRASAHAGGAAGAAGAGARAPPLMRRHSSARLGVAEASVHAVPAYGGGVMGGHMGDGAGAGAGAGSGGRDSGRRLADAGRRLMRDALG